MGHMHAQKSSVQSTKPKIAKLPISAKQQDEEEEKDELLEQQEPPRPGVLLGRKERVGAHVVDLTALKGYIAIIPCGRYPTMSNRGMKYIFVLYDYYSNAILAAPNKSRKGADMAKAYDECYKQLKDDGVTPILQYVDNEVSKELIATTKDKKLLYQLASPHDHRLNPAERAI